MRERLVLLAGLRFDDPGRLAWESVLPLSGRETDHVVYRGSLGDFPSDRRRPAR